MQKSGVASQYRMVDGVEDDPDVRGIRREAPVVFDGDLDTPFASVVGHLLERLDGAVQVGDQGIIFRVAGRLIANRGRPDTGAERAG